MDISSTSYYPLVLSSYFIAMPIFADADLSNQKKKENTHKSKSQASDESQVANYYSVL